MVNEALIWRSYCLTSSYEKNVRFIIDELTQTTTVKDPTVVAGDANSPGFCWFTFDTLCCALALVTAIHKGLKMYHVIDWTNN